MDTRELYMCSVVRDDPIHYISSIFLLMIAPDRNEMESYTLNTSTPPAVR
jgi:hypothetical protein